MSARCRRRPILAAAVLLAAVPVTAGTARAQVPADAAWRTFSSSNFRITYQPGLEDIARHAAASAERARAALAVLVTDAPGLVDIVVADNVDFSNGYAGPFPSRRIVIYAKPPADVLELQYTRDWVELLVAHELAHIFHLDVSGRVGRWIRRLFGRIPAPWPVFPAIGVPGWSVEGLAVGIESTVAGFGRVHGSYHEMVVRTAALEGRIDDYDRLSSASPVWPGQQRIYIYGSLFFDYLTRRFGPDATARVVRSTAGAILPPPLWFGRVGRHALGVSFREAYEDWREELETRYAELTRELTAHGLTSGEPLAREGGRALYPRYSPAGRFVAYAAHDRRRAPRIRIVDAATGAEVRTRRRNDPAPVAWLDDERILTSDLEFIDAFRIYSDIYRIGAGGEERLTRGARLQDVDVAPRGGRAVAVENGDGKNRLVLLDSGGAMLRSLTDFEDGSLWSLPRFSPSGDRIAVGRWRTGGVYDVVVLDTLGRLRTEIPGDVGVNAAPAWDPSGRWLLFWSDRTGIPNLYAADLGAADADIVPGTRTPVRVRQVTNVLTGAFFPDVSPDGRWIVFSAYHDDGFSIERIPFDTATWRDPLPASLHDLAEARAAAPATPQATAFADSVDLAFHAADTTSGPAGRYRALRHLRPYTWFPLVQTGAGGEDYYGLWTYGQDLVDRHQWNLAFTVAPSSGRTAGTADYSYLGLPTIRALGVHPTITLAGSREWETFPVGVDTTGGDAPPSVDAREDMASLALGLIRTRWRSTTALFAAGDLVRRSRHLYNAPGRSLVDPADDLYGVRATAFFGSFVMPPFAISREDGLVLQVSARQRWEREPREIERDGDRIVFDAGYRELTTWNAAYLAFPLAGFARHVVAGRASALVRDGPGAAPTSIGGASGHLQLPGVHADLAGASRFLPVRGFDEGARWGDRAWTASIEYRLPLLLVTRSLRPLPIFLDRFSAAAFLDAGDAWCSPRAAARIPDVCPRTTPAAPLLGTGAELAIRGSLLGFAAAPLRLGIGFPLNGTTRDPRLYLLSGASF